MWLINPFMTRVASTPTLTRLRFEHHVPSRISRQEIRRFSGAPVPNCSPSASPSPKPSNWQAECEVSERRGTLKNCPFCWYSHIFRHTQLWSCYLHLIYSMNFHDITDITWYFKYVPTMSRRFPWIFPYIVNSGKSGPRTFQPKPVGPHINIQAIAQEMACRTRTTSPIGFILFDIG